MAAASVPSVDQSSDAATSAMIDLEGKARVAGAGSVLREDLSIAWEEPVRTALC